MGRQREFPKVSKPDPNDSFERKELLTAACS